MRAVDYSKLTERKCSVCKKVRPIDDFHPQTAACAKLRRTEWTLKSNICKR